MIKEDTEVSLIIVNMENCDHAITCNKMVRFRCHRFVSQL